MGMVNAIRQKHPRYRFLDLLPHDATVLDIGSGNGVLQKRLHQYRPDLKFISVDKKDFTKEYPSGTFFRIDICIDPLPIESEAIDAVFCSHVFEHLFSCDLLLSEIRRVLKSTGRIYIETPSTRTMLLPSCGLLLGLGAPTNFYDDPTHIRPFTRNSLYVIGKRLGLREIRTGFARNWLYCLSAPLILLYSIVKRDKQVFAVVLWNVTGGCVYLWGNGIAGRHSGQT